MRKRSILTKLYMCEWMMSISNKTNTVTTWLSHHILYYMSCNKQKMKLENRTRNVAKVGSFVRLLCHPINERTARNALSENDVWEKGANCYFLRIVSHVHPFQWFDATIEHQEPNTPMKWQIYRLHSLMRRSIKKVEKEQDQTGDDEKLMYKCRYWNYRERSRRYIIQKNRNKKNGIMERTKIKLYIEPSERERDRLKLDEILEQVKVAIEQPE